MYIAFFHKTVDNLGDTVAPYSCVIESQEELQHHAECLSKLAEETILCFKYAMDGTYQGSNYS